MLQSWRCSTSRQIEAERMYVGRLEERIDGFATGDRQGDTPKITHLRARLEVPIDRP